MKLLNCRVSNFGSWKELEFDFSTTGLALVHGATGSGKSTLLDIVPWILFGQTSKGGSVEEIRSWQADGESTVGTLTVQYKGVDIHVSRTRGAGGKNDLFWVDSDGQQTRGKDLNDTQKLLEDRLAVSADIFLDGSYYHEFSSTATFFTAKAKERRALFENVCDLRFPLRLAEKCIQEKKVSRDKIKTLQSKLDKLCGRINSLSEQLSSCRVSSGAWEAARLRAIAAFTFKAEAFEEEKLKKIIHLEEKSQTWKKKTLEKLSVLSARAQELKILVKPVRDLDLAEAKARNESRCGSCGALPENIAQLLETIIDKKFNNNRYISELKDDNRQIKELKEALNPHSGALTAALQEVNTYSNKAKEAEESVNPFLAQLQESGGALVKTEKDKVEAEADLGATQHHYNSLSHLYDLSFELRGHLISTAIQEIQDETNRYLEAYFDAELKVGFESRDADNLEISIQKSGYECSYTQLSKGQRQLLRLSFSLAVMKFTADSNGVHFSTMMLDEPTDGCDTNLKLKAYRLFEELAKDHNVLVIDHSPDLAVLFPKKYHVSLYGDHSQLEETIE